MFSTIIMRVENHVHICHIMLYHFEKGHKAAEAFRDLNELFGEGTIGERQVRRWFERFKSGDTSLEDEGGRGRPSDFDDQALLSDESRTMVDWSTLNISANNRVVRLSSSSTASNKA